MKYIVNLHRCREVKPHCNWAYLLQDFEGSVLLWGEFVIASDRGCDLLTRLGRLP